MLKKVLITAVVIIYSLALVSSTYAAPAPPAPICQIEGEILSLDKKVWQTEYKVTLKLANITTYEAVNFNWIKCDEKYKSSLEKREVSYIDDKPQPLEKGMIIRGLVHFAGDEFGSATRLYNVQILSQPNIRTTWFSAIILKIRQILTSIQSNF